MLPRVCRRHLVTRNVFIIFIVLALLALYKRRLAHREKISNIIHGNKTKKIFAPSNSSSKKLNTPEIENIILESNKKQTIYNQKVYGPIKQDTIIIVISVSKYLNLNFMILSLARVKSIKETLIIFSHSRYDDNVNHLIKGIKFCRVLQIYYPHSLQLHPNNFPGFTPGDCTYQHSLNEAEDLNCTGAWTPDIHGRFRNPEHAEMKHFWWWTANQVFENLEILENHNGTVVFAEDSYIFMEDFIYMTRTMKRASNAVRGCEFLSLAASAPPSDGEEAIVEIKTWDPNFHAGVLGFNIYTWNSIVSHYHLFCDIDDYSWPESLLYVSINRIDGECYRVISSKFPRAYKSNTCVYFGTFMECNVHSAVAQIYSLQRRKSSLLFPKYLEVITDVELKEELRSLDYATINGGWNDPRDKALCRNLTVFKIKREIMRMDRQFQDVPQ